MAFGLIPLEKRIKDNIKNYSLDRLFDTASLGDYFEALSQVSRMQFLLTDRHGEKAVCCGDFIGFSPDVVNEPGYKIKIANRTVAHLYVREDGAELGELRGKTEKRLVESVIERLTKEGEAVYREMETSLYTDELEKLLEKEQYQVKHGEKLDALTGVLNSTYFESRMKVIDRSETVPVGIICANINDWKYVNDNYGDEESDRLIQTVASILKEKARPEYVIGRCGGDLFYILIPLSEDGETEAYVKDVQKSCDAFEDDKLSPSVACGKVIKTNVEQSIRELLSDAEYEMFENKYEMKNAPGYRERLEKLR